MGKEEQELARWADIVENQIRSTNNVQLEDIQNAFEHITEEKNKGLYGLCNYHMAYYDLKNGKTDECLDYLNESIRCMVGTPQEQNVSRSYNVLGVIAHGQNNLLMAAEQYNMALTYADRYKDHFMRNIVVSNMADMYHRMGAYDKSFQCYRESMKEYEQSGDHSASGMGNYMMMLAGYGYCLCMADRLEDAKAVSEQLFPMQEGEYGEMFPSLYAYTFSALLFFKLGQKEKASDSLKIAVQAAISKKQLAGDFDGILNLLELLILMEKFDYLGEVLDYMEPLAQEENNNGLMLQLLAWRLRYCGDKMSDEQYMERAGVFFRLKEEFGNSESNLVIHMLEIRRRLWNIEEEQKALEMENTRLRYQVDHDELSGLNNKGSLNRHAQESFDRAMREALTLSVLFVDIDFFKQLNDGYGHRKGDECIRVVADSIKESFSEDFAARYGGDEFVVIACGRSEEYIRKGAERIVESVRAKQIPNINSCCADVLTVTVGIIHAIPHKPNRVWDFMAAADETLYQQKKERKGCVRFNGRLG